MRVVEGRRYAGLSAETLLKVLILSQMRRKHFQGDYPVRGCVVGTVYTSHPAAPQQVQDSVMTE
ncbi:hypothetical protein A5621_15265 [Mycobacterium colombiense]|nr:hypothetical protein A5621_15265 [Mycobacterium colombiense]